MKRILLIFLSLVLALVGWTTVCADDGFYVVAGIRGNYAPVSKTGQATSYGTRDDGALQKGVAWPSPRFSDNGNGTVTDNLTRLIWMKNAGGIGTKTWNEALNEANSLHSGMYDLADGSQVGDWRLPNVREFQSLVDFANGNPALPAGHPFTGVHSDFYWSSTTYSFDINRALEMALSDGLVLPYDKGAGRYVWCVRGGS